MFTCLSRMVRSWFMPQPAIRSDDMQGGTRSSQFALQYTTKSLSRLSRRTVESWPPSVNLRTWSMMSPCPSCDWSCAECLVGGLPILWHRRAREHVVPATSGGERDKKPEEEQDGDAPEGRDHVPAFSNGAWHRTSEGAEYSIGLSHYIGCVGQYG